jgi:hypothetical protein
MDSVGVGSTLTAGIQDIAALLPLLGTEQCEDNVSSALTKGYLYAVATPLSIFGSLGMARAGLKTLIASSDIPKLNIVGAQVLANMGFKPQGTNVPQIMIYEDEITLIQHRLYERFFEPLHTFSEASDDANPRVIRVSHKYTRWNAVMVLLTAVASLLSVVPYVYLNLKGNSALTLTTRWAFPLIRALGGFLTATTMQLVIQLRVTTLIKRELKSEGLELQMDTGNLESVSGEKKAEYTYLDKGANVFVCIQNQEMSLITIS